MAADWTPSGTLDLGDGHHFRFHGPADADGYPIGGIETHRTPAGEVCEGSILFASAPERYKRRTARPDDHCPTWTVESWEPLTLSPSLPCTMPDCGSHGYIRDGRWVGA